MNNKSKMKNAIILHGGPDKKEYYDPEKVNKHPEMIKFILWIKKKEPDFYDKNINHNRKKK